MNCRPEGNNRMDVASKLHLEMCAAVDFIWYFLTVLDEEIKERI